MSKYHIIGITNGGTLEQVTALDDEGSIDETAIRWKPRYRRLFLVQTDRNVRELVVVPPTKECVKRDEFAPSIDSYACAGEGKG